MTLVKYRGSFWFTLKSVTNDGTCRKSNIYPDLLSTSPSLSSSQYLSLHGTSAYRGTSSPKHSLKLNCKEHLHEHRYSLQNTGSIVLKISRCCFIVSVNTIESFCVACDLTITSLSKWLL